MSPKKHTHKYQRVNLGGEKVETYIDEKGKKKKRLVKTLGTQVYKCVTCPTSKLRHMVLGDTTICWECGQEMLMTMESITRVRPIHFACRKEKKK